MAAVLDARRGEAFLAVYTGDRELLAPTAVSPEMLAAALSGTPRPVLAVGDGAIRFSDHLQAAGVAIPADASSLHSVDAAVICRLADRTAVSASGAVVPCIRTPSGRRDLPGGCQRVNETSAAEIRAEPPNVEIRRLVYADLPQVIEIERRAFPTPWSLAMFVLELSKPSGVCLAASIDGRLVGYVICSRYETVWHVMNVAVDPEHVRRGVASALLADLYERVGDDEARFTLEVRRSNTVAIELYERDGFRAAGIRRRYYQDNGEDAVIMWRTPATLAGSLDDVPNPGHFFG